MHPNNKKKIKMPSNSWLERSLKKLNFCVKEFLTYKKTETDNHSKSMRISNYDNLMKILKFLSQFFLFLDIFVLFEFLCCALNSRQ